MILYIKEKSKKAYLRQGIALLIGLLFFYIFFIQIKLVKESSTLQIISPDAVSVQNKVSGKEEFEENSQVGEYLYVSSKKGKYYYPKDCGRARTLSVKNMLYFKDKMTAEDAGYMPYLGCF